MPKLTGYIIRNKDDKYSSTNENGDWCFDHDILRADIYTDRSDAQEAINENKDDFTNCDVLLIGLAYEVVLS